VGATFEKGEAGENGDEDVGVETAHVFGVGQVESGGLEARLQFGERIGVSDFLQGNDVGVDCGEAPDNFGAALGGFDLSGAGGADDVVFEVERGDAERVLSAV
jgi:hypothetical protein